MHRRGILVLTAIVTLFLALGTARVIAAQSPAPADRPGLAPIGQPGVTPSFSGITNAQRQAAAARLAQAQEAPLGALLGRLRGLLVTPKALDPLGIPDYFGTVPNYANSPLPTLDGGGNVIGGGIRKFVDSLPGLGESSANDLGQFIPVATPDTATYPGSDYYVIALVRYGEKMHADVPTTTLQGYVQVETATTTGAHFPLTYPDGSPILDAGGTNCSA